VNSPIIDPHAAIRQLAARARIIPIASTMAASALATLPAIAQVAVMPPFGLLMLLAWRLLRPEMWPAWMALPLGLFDDLMTGQPLGSAMACWTISLLALDMMDNRAMWRDYWIEWLIAAAVITACILGGWIAVEIISARERIAHGTLLAVIPQIATTILCFPLAMRACAGLDKWRFER
jgi:rod shape-determining protein MreD